eukprot:CAMPEP_0196655772 /NCGR_PEP_ID=MMETSP1086-20130531/8188_1 /TAXON_ID=77921 /ORGANISM="Cyanoptyche  gloeocystis , Strain SAG4.97" /LENGTH=210 /DNA_ID=CAMNT_0041988265 /DNA_START=46 /DNA_END=678 /DNA_ORIENTATION=+
MIAFSTAALVSVRQPLGPCAKVSTNAQSREQAGNIHVIRPRISKRFSVSSRPHKYGGSRFHVYKSISAEYNDTNRSLQSVSDDPSKEGRMNPEYSFWDTRAGVFAVGGIVLVAGVAFYYGLQFAGVEEIQAGIWTEIAVAGGVIVLWTLSYLSRFFNKELGYFKQREEYEEAVIRKRYEELTDEQWTKMVEEMKAKQERRKEAAAKKDKK